MALTGKELVEIRRISATGRPASVTTETTTQEIADLAGDSGIPVPISSGGTGTGLSLNLVFAKCLDAASQTAGSGNTTRNTYNTNALNGDFAQYGVTNVFDNRSYTDTSVGSGIWIPGTSYDGIHPSSTCHTSMATAYASTFVSLNAYP